MVSSRLSEAQATESRDPPFVVYPHTSECMFPSFETIAASRPSLRRDLYTPFANSFPAECPPNESRLRRLLRLNQAGVSSCTTQLKTKTPRIG